MKQRFLVGERVRVTPDRGYGEVVDVLREEVGERTSIPEQEISGYVVRLDDGDAITVYRDGNIEPEEIAEQDEEAAEDAEDMR